MTDIVERSENLPITESREVTVGGFSVRIEAPQWHRSPAPATVRTTRPWLRTYAARLILSDQIAVVTAVTAGWVSGVGSPRSEMVE